MTYASLGPGTISQMCIEAFKLAAGIDLTEVRYEGIRLALTDVIGGNADAALEGTASATAQLAAGNVKALAVTTEKRSTLLPHAAIMKKMRDEVYSMVN